MSLLWIRLPLSRCPAIAFPGPGWARLAAGARAAQLCNVVLLHSCASGLRFSSAPIRLFAFVTRGKKNDFGRVWQTWASLFFFFFSSSYSFFFLQASGWFAQSQRGRPACSFLFPLSLLPCCTSALGSSALRDMRACPKSQLSSWPAQEGCFLLLPASPSRTHTHTHIPLSSLLFMCAASSLFAGYLTLHCRSFS